jgi:hypothetical protein
MPSRAKTNSFARLCTDSSLPAEQTFSLSTISLSLCLLPMLVFCVRPSPWVREAPSRECTDSLVLPRAGSTLVTGLVFPDQGFQVPTGWLPTGLL